MWKSGKPEFESKAEYKYGNQESWNRPTWFQIKGTVSSFPDFHIQ
jgi:hypothetical protein